MALKFYNIVAALAINLLHYVTSDDILSCNVTSLHPCPELNQICDEKTSKCIYMKGTDGDNGDCQSADCQSAASRGGTAAIVSIFTIALIICGLILVIRKYNLIAYVRDKINRRRNNDVMYEDVMIGDDDPPLSP